MNSRERTLLIVLIGIVGGGIVLFFGNQWFFKPLREASARISELQEEIEKYDDQINAYQRDQKKLALARRKSLPANPDVASSEYMSYLRKVLTESGLTVDDLTHTPAVEMKVAAALPTGIKKVGHQVIMFNARAHGDLGPLVKAMDIIQRTPYEHRIKNLTLERADSNNVTSGKLSINMIVETLLVAKTENEAGIPPGIDPKYLVLDGIAGREGGLVPLGWGLLGSTVRLMQAMPTPPDHRKYSMIARKNIFMDAKTWTIEPKEIDTSTPDPNAPEEFVPQYVRLVMTEPTQSTAYLRNLIYSTRETKLIAKPNSGYELFRITDEENNYVYFTAKVLRVDPRDMYFQIKNQVYALHIGQTVADVMDHPLSLERLDDLDLDYDRSWAADQQKSIEKKSVEKRKAPDPEKAPAEKGAKGAGRKKGNKGG